ncbi:hypothetical protein [Tenacibaculum aiptasiae]|uniref:hypothetical protein n=1 Tax=Tenacibaculum aiptasiae TaxID=426481 RepID=UPI003B592911
MVRQEIQHSDYRIRKLIGLLGLLLPLILLFSGGELLSSMSHYYYKTLSSLLFIIILSTFGLFLISYKGYKIDKETEKISDDFITNIGGIAALIVVFVPTHCSGSKSFFIDKLCSNNLLPLLGHNNDFKTFIHLLSAGIFILSMGWVSKYKFTRGENKTYNKVYRLCGNIVFGSVAILAIIMIISLFKKEFQLTNYDVFIFETIAVIPFSISWLIKGQTINYLKNIF